MHTKSQPFHLEIPDSSPFMPAQSPCCQKIGPFCLQRINCQLTKSDPLKSALAVAGGPCVNKRDARHLAASIPDTSQRFDLPAELDTLNSEHQCLYLSDRVCEYLQTNVPIASHSQAIMWRRAYLFLVLVRLYFALSPSYLHPDENFQGPEVIAGT